MHSPGFLTRVSLFAAFVGILAAPRVLAAQETGASRDSLARRVERLQRRLDSLEQAGKTQEQRLMELDERTAAAADAGRRSGDTSLQRSLASTRGIYGKPFVRRFGSGTAVGGYMDLEFRRDFTARTMAFDQRRMVPFLYSEITDRLHFGTEIEFEHGPALENADGVAEGAGEVKVEFATLDYRFHESLNLRGGVLLSPLGRFNLTHDSPLNELTDRPLAALQVIPSTLSEAGVGFFGTLYPSGRSLVTYEAYVVNGFDAALGEPDGRRLPIRDAAGKRGDVANAPMNFVGRLAASPFLGLEVGASAHAGPYGGYGDTKPAGSTPNASIWALDATLNRGRFDVLAEYARLHVTLADSLRAIGVAPGREGFYLQGNYHFGQGWIAPRATSAFTAVARYDFVNYQLGTGAADDRQRAVTAGLNWRPVPDAAFKSDVRWDWTSAGSGSYGPAARRLALSMATYF